MKKALLIDGENFRKKLADVFASNNTKSPKWYEYDFRGLLGKVLEGIKLDEEVFYFGKLKIHEDTEDKSKQLVEEQRLLKTHLERSGFKVILAGMVRGQYEDGLLKKKLRFREKGVDVKIAVDMVSSACDGLIQEFVIGSSDSDLQPAIKEVKKRGSVCIYLGFENNPNKGLTFTTKKTILIRDQEVLKFSQIS